MFLNGIWTLSVTFIFNKTIRLPTNYLKRLFVNSTRFASEILQKQYGTLYPLIFWWLTFFAINFERNPTALSLGKQIKIYTTTNEGKWNILLSFCLSKTTLMGKLCRDQSTIKSTHIGNQQKEKKESMTNSSLSRHMDKFRRYSKLAILKKQWNGEILKFEKSKTFLL